MAVSMHFGDYTFIFLLALVLFGPKKMPEMGRQLGKLLAEFRRASNEFKFQIQEELRNMEEEERKKKLAESLALADASSKAMAEVLPPPAVDAGPAILPPAIGEPVSTARPFAVPVSPPETPSTTSPEPVALETTAPESPEPIAPQSRAAIAAARSTDPATQSPAPNGAAEPVANPAPEPAAESALAPGPPAALTPTLPFPDTPAESLTNG